MKKIIIAVAAITIVVLLIMGSGEQRITRIKRPDYNSQSEIHNLIIKQDGKESEIEIIVPPKEIPSDKLQEVFDMAYEEILTEISGENECLSRVTKKLNMITEVTEYGIKADYYSDNMEIVDSYGNVYNKGLDAPVKIKVFIDLSYKDMTQRYEIPLMVFPAELSETEKLNEQINEIIKNQSDEEYVVLPDNLEGTEVSFVKKGPGLGVVFLLGAAVTIAMIYNRKVSKPKKASELRKKQMMSDYSEIVSKLSLLMGAGMSSYNALCKMAADYKMLKSAGNVQERFAYEELTACVNRISAGTPETQAYKELGKNCGIHSYVKMCSFLTQNINKGNANIFELLKEETKEAFEERKAIARRIGEEAGTKLLGPMVMMLSVVLVIVIVPAFMSL
jgi:hypothetical protein